MKMYIPFKALVFTGLSCLCAFSAGADIIKVSCVDKAGKHIVDPRAQFHLLNLQMHRSDAGGGFTFNGYRVTGKRFCTEGRFPLQFYTCLITLSPEREVYTCTGESTISHQGNYGYRYSFAQPESLMQAVPAAPDEIVERPPARRP